MWAAAALAGSAAVGIGAVAVAAAELAVDIVGLVVAVGTAAIESEAACGQQ